MMKNILWFILLGLMFASVHVFGNTRHDEYSNNSTSFTWRGSGMRFEQGVSDQIPAVYVLRTDSATVSNTIAVSPLAFTIIAGATNYIDCNLAYRTAAVTTGLGIGLRVPGTAQDVSYTAHIPLQAQDGLSSSLTGYGTDSNDMILGTGVQASTSTFIAELTGVVVNGPSAGRITVVFQSEVNTSEVTLKAGSHCRLYAVNEP